MNNRTGSGSLIKYAALILALSPCALFAQQAEISPRTHARATFQETLARYLFDQDRGKAREGFLLSLQQDPTYALPHYNLGVLAEAEEDWNDAITYFEDFLRLDQMSTYATKARSEVARLKQVRELDRTPEGKQRRRYEDAISKSMIKDAVRAAAIATQIDDRRWEAYALAATALSKQEFYEDAEWFLKQSIARAPEKIKINLANALEFCRERRKR
jgi:tetratricopeptide (TPR) repeat protein